MSKAPKIIKCAKCNSVVTAKSVHIVIVRGDGPDDSASVPVCAGCAKLIKHADDIVCTSHDD